MNQPTARRKFTNTAVKDLHHYRLPIPGVVSILHRISGLLLFLSLPFLLFLFDKSISSESSYYHLSGILSHPLVQLILLILTWGFFHHLCAGIRYLAMDLHHGVKKDAARRSATRVFAVSIVITLLFFFLVLR